MATYLFDDEKAEAACERYLSDGAVVLSAERQADVDGFLRILRSDAGQKLRVASSKVGATPGLSPEGPYSRG